MCRFSPRIRSRTLHPKQQQALSVLRIQLLIGYRFRLPSSHTCHILVPPQPRATVVSASRRQPRAGKKKNPTTSHPSPASPPPDSAQAPLPTHSPPSTTPLIPTVLRGDPSGAHPSIPTPTTSRDRKGFGTPPSRNQLQSTAEPDRGEDEEEGRGGGDSVPREKVFVACAVTSGTLGALGVAFREVCI